MDTPNFILQPVPNHVLKTCCCLMCDCTVKQAAHELCLSPYTIEGHTKQLREAMHAKTLQGAVARVIALGIITQTDLLKTLPPGWEQFIQH
jgi:hypothetical protein